MAKTFRAVYKDAAGKSFSAPVELVQTRWVMITSEGPQPLVREFFDDVGGKLLFDSYREVTADSPHQIHVAIGGSWNDHKNAFAAQQLAPQHRTREQERTAMQEAPLNDRTAARAVAAYLERQQIAAAMRPPNGKVIIKE